MENENTEDGYVCQACGIKRPGDWFVYEIENGDSWLSPCCSLCARAGNSRGPFPQKQMADTRIGATVEINNLVRKIAELKGLVDGAYEIVEMWNASSPSQREWRENWLKRAIANGASPQ